MHPPYPHAVCALKEEPKHKKKKSRPDVLEELSAARSGHSERRAVQAKFLDTEATRTNNRLVHSEFSQAGERDCIHDWCLGSGNVWSGRSLRHVLNAPMDPELQWVGAVGPSILARLAARW